MQNAECKMQNERRLIDAEALSDEVDESKHNNPHPPGLVRVNHRNEHDHFLRMILDAPTVDAVEVVRCKNCKRWVTTGKRAGNREDGQLIGCCELARYGRRADDFCSYGERREGE